MRSRSKKKSKKFPGPNKKTKKNTGTATTGEPYGAKCCAEKKGKTMKKKRLYPLYIACLLLIFHSCSTKLARKLMEFG